jgi:hypothetical protein
MPVLALFGLSIVFSFVAWGIVTTHFIWPELRDHPPVDALQAGQLTWKSGIN